MNTTQTTNKKVARGITDYGIMCDEHSGLILYRLLRVFERLQVIDLWDGYYDDSKHCAIYRIVE